MDIHVCKQCGTQFVYCRMCTFRPIRYKEKGFCSKECYEASKVQVAPKVEIEPIVEEVLTEYVAPINEETLAEVDVEAVALEETSIEATTVVEHTIKNETNTYKKKKNKYKVHE